MNNKILDIAFYGSSNFSLVILKKLFEFHSRNLINLKYVISQPAKPFGRKKELKDNLVVEFCKQNNISILTPNKIKELFGEGESNPYENQLSIKSANDLNIDIAFVAAYGKILPKRLLDTAKEGFLNFHGSLLPAYRGAAPVQYTILNQDIDAAGVSLIKMNEGMDTGEIIQKLKLKIQKEEFENLTSGELMEKLAELSSEMLENNLNIILNSEEWNLEVQDEEKASYCYIADMAKANFEIKYEDGFKKGHGKIMSANPDPKAWFTLERLDSSKVKTEKIKVNVLKSKFVSETELNCKKFGKLDLQLYESINYFEKNDKKIKKLMLEFNDGFLEILELQLEGKQPVKAIDYINAQFR